MIDYLSNIKHECVRGTKEKARPKGPALNVCTTLPMWMEPEGLMPAAHTYSQFSVKSKYVMGKIALLSGNGGMFGVITLYSRITLNPAWA